jgi:beta-glucosidase-like glycosyl hydrolase
MSDPARLIFPSFTIGKQDPLEAVNLAKLGVGGFCLYRGTPETVAQIARRLRRAAKYPLLLCADYEEGAWAHVQGSTPLPTNLGMGMAASVEEAREKGRLTAVEARAMGIDWVLAPVLDVLSETKNPIVNVRSFSDDPKRLITFARAYMVGLKRGRALNCLKHFPGHGSTTIDSHLGLPTVTSSRRTLLHRELAPFRGLLAYADAVMLGHLVVPALGDLRRPMTLSEVGPKLLRSWGFRGLITTDALDMGAISKHWGDLEAPLMALKGGADILLVPKDPVRLIQELRRTAGHEPFMSKRCEESIKRLDRALLHTKGARRFDSI